MNRQITIIGAGIGGLTAALALKQSGAEVAVYESASELKPAGAGIAMAGNAMQLFDRLGLRDKIEKRGSRISSLWITDEQLQPLSVTELHLFEKKYNASNVAIHRADLQQILAEEVGFADIHLGKTLTRISPGYPVRLTFADHTTLDSDILIGADGIHSNIRKQLFPLSRIRDTGQVCWRGVLPTHLSGIYPHEAYEAWGKGKRFGFVRINEDSIYWFAVVNEKLVGTKELPELFSDFHPHVLELIAQTQETQIIKNQIIDLKPIPSWHTGNICLMGDAAHATTPNLGQGACQAVEDAYALGQLFKSNKEPEAIFSHFEALRMKKAHFIVHTSWRMGKIAQWENSMAVGIRNGLLRLLLAFASRKQLDGILDIGYLKAL